MALRVARTCVNMKPPYLKPQNSETLTLYVHYTEPHFRRHFTLRAHQAFHRRNIPIITIKPSETPTGTQEPPGAFNHYRVAKPLINAIPNQLVWRR